MIAFLKIFLSILLSLVSVFTSPVIGNYKAPFQALEPEKVKLNFAAISDTHLNGSSGAAFMLELGLAGMEKSEEALDALVISGDITNNGRPGEYETLFNAFANRKPANEIILAEGNHDARSDDKNYETAKGLFIEYNKKIAGRELSAPYYSTEINGYSFICLASESQETPAYFSDAQIEWFKAEMEKAAAKGLPIFVVCHWSINESHGLPGVWGAENPTPETGGIGKQSAEIEKILKTYENVFFINGHLHNGFTNEYTSDYYGFDIVESDGSFHSINLPSYANVNIRGTSAPGLGCQIEVYEDRVELRPRSYTADVWYVDYNVTIPLA